MKTSKCHTSKVSILWLVVCFAIPGLTAHSNAIAVETKWQRRAEDGNAEAQYRFGEAYRSVGNTIDAAKWFTKAAEQGHVEALFELAEMDVSGVIHAPERTKLLTKAAEQGHTLSQIKLAEMHKAGRGALKSDTKAEEWFAKATTQRDPEIQFRIGRRYYSGDGLPEDDVKAAEWFTKAAKQGHALSQYYTGAMYRTGRGVSRSDIMAAEWYTKAAEQGHSGAQSQLGEMYEEGEGVVRDLVLAYTWYNLARAERRRDILERKMSPAQITEAQRLSDNWEKGQPLER